MSMIPFGVESLCFLKCSKFGSRIQVPYELEQTLTHTWCLEVTVICRDTRTGDPCACFFVVFMLASSFGFLVATSLVRFKVVNFLVVIN